MSGRLVDKVVVVTGAGRGIGRAHALALGREGACVVVNDVGDASAQGLAEAVAEEIRSAGGEALADANDVSDTVAAAGLIEATLDAYGGLDALVNNAAVDFRGSIEDHTADDWDRVMAVNARGSFNCARAAIPALRRRGGGAILNTTSGAFWEGTEGVVAYAASKAVAFSLTLSLHGELAREGIRSNCIAPGATRTRMVEGWLAQLAEDPAKDVAAIVAHYGIQEPENLAALAVVLCSEAARGISGHVFEVQGDRIGRIEPPGRVAAIQRRGELWQVEDLASRLPELVS